jgi:hypothetical protein
VLLAAEQGLAGFALCRERIEFLFQAFLRGFAGVDRAAKLADDRLDRARNLG